MKAWTIATVACVTAGLLAWSLGARTAPDASQAPAAHAAADPAGDVWLLTPDVPAANREAAAPPRGHGASDALVVLVHDPASAPVAGVPLCLCDGDGHSLAQSTSDAAGRATLAHVRRALATAPEPCVVRAEVPFADPPEIAVEHAPGDELVLALPWGGRIDVVVQDADGNELADAREVELSTPLADGRESRRWSAPVRAGHAGFPWVELGRSWNVFVWGAGDAAVLGRGDGPRMPRATARIEVACAPEVAFTLCAVDPSGTPIVHAALELRLDGGGAHERRDAVETDADGRFPVRWVQGLRLPGALLVSSRRAEGDVRVGRVEATSVLRPNGAVVLAPERVLTAGRVLDGERRPIADATVEAAVRLGSAPFGPAPLVARSDADGRFELHGLLPARELELRAHKGALTSAVAHAAEGATAIELVVGPQCALRGRVVAGDVRPDSIELTVLDGERELASTRPSAVDGSFAFTQLAVQVVRLRVALHGDELASFDRIALPADADIGTIDLTGLVHRCALTLHGASGEPSGTLAWRACGSDEPWRRAPFRGRAFELVTARPCLDLCVLATGCRAVRATGVAGELALDLAPPLVVRLVLETDGELPAYPHELVPELRLDGLEVATPRGLAGFSRETHTVVLEVGAPGTLALTWRLERHAAERGGDGATRYGSGGSTATRVLAGEAAEIDVLDGAGVQEITLHLGAAALASITAAGR